MSEPQKLWRKDFEATNKLDMGGLPWRDNRFAISKDENGVLTAKLRAGAGTSGAPDTAAQPQPGAQQQLPQTTPAGPASVGSDGKLVVGDLSLSADDIKSILAEKAQRDSRTATMPTDAASYELSLPENFQLPAGVAEWKWNLEDPTSAAMLGQAKNWAFAHGLDQTAFSGMLGLHAAYQVAEQQKFAAAQRGEIEKLGANAPARVDAINTWLEARLGSDLAGALRASMFTSKSVEAFEKLLRAFTSQGVSGSPGAGRDGAHGAGPPRLSEAEYSKLSYHETIQYAQQFRQT